MKVSDPILEPVVDMRQNFEWEQNVCSSSGSEIDDMELVMDQEAKPIQIVPIFVPPLSFSAAVAKTTEKDSPLTKSFTKRSQDYRTPVEDERTPKFGSNTASILLMNVESNRQKHRSKSEAWEILSNRKNTAEDPKAKKRPNRVSRFLSQFWNLNRKKESTIQSREAEASNSAIGMEVKRPNRKSIEEVRLEKLLHEAHEIEILVEKAQYGNSPILEHIASSPLPRKTFIEPDTQRENRSAFENASWWIFGPDQWLRIQLLRITNSNAFDYAMFVTILLSCIQMAFERPAIEPGSTEDTILFYLDVCFTAIFGLEFIMKSIALTFTVYIQTLTNKVKIAVLIVLILFR